MKVVLERYHGLGNDYVVFDPNKNELELTSENVRMICDRNEGLGSDGVLEERRWNVCKSLESRWKRVRDQRKRSQDLREISQGRKLRTEEKF